MKRQRMTRSPRCWKNRCSPAYVEDTVRRLAELGVDTAIRDRPRQGLDRLCEKDAGSAICVIRWKLLHSCSSALHHERSLTMPQTENMRRAALVTGGAKGIGRAVCLALAENGMNIAVNYAGSAAAAEETALPAAPLACRPSRCKRMCAAPKPARSGEDTAAAFGRIDVLVNNAGITADKLLMRMTEADFDNVLVTNLKGTFFCTKAASRLMMRQRYGRIINISSVVGLHGNAGQANYAASKAGLIGLTKSVAKEYAARNITANAVAPGFIDNRYDRRMPESARAAAQAAIPAGRTAVLRMLPRRWLSWPENRPVTSPGRFFVLTAEWECEVRLMKKNAGSLSPALAR